MGECAEQMVAVVEEVREEGGKAEARAVAAKVGEGMGVVRGSRLEVVGVLAEARVAKRVKGVRAALVRVAAQAAATHRLVTHLLMTLRMETHLVLLKMALQAHRPPQLLQ